MCKNDRFCNDCRAVIFDDKVAGSFVADEDTERFLKLDQDDRLRKLPVEYQLNDTYPDLPRLFISANEGCGLCKTLRDTIQSADVDDALARAGFNGTEATELTLTMDYIWRAPGCSFGLSMLIVNLSMKRDDVIDSNHWLRFMIESGSDDPCQRWLRIDNFAVLPADSLSPNALSWTREMLDSCSSVCHPVTETKFLPSRLVRVDCNPPRLIETRHLARSGGLENLKYAALSYCWGKPNEAKMQLKTERTTVNVMLEGIPEPKMTRVLKEATQATRALGIPYLWIDALCIIQGDKEDWENESKMMGKIYNEAYCTLCAISSNSCLEGFLQLRPALLSIPFSSKLDPSITGEYSLRFGGIVSGQNRSLECFRYSMAYEDFAASNWTQRGWTYQEYALSKRLVAFSHNTVHFICPSGSQTLGHTSDYEDDGVDFFQVDHLEADMTKDEAYTEWSNVAADFSRRLFTYPEDRFPAISGLAGYFGDILGDEYLAGLWKGDLWRGLYWGVGVNVAASWAALLEQLSKPNVYRAPSWSWASRDRMASFGEASYDRGVFAYGSSDYVAGFRCECKSIEGRAARDGPERYLTGEVEGGSLLLMTRTCPLPGPIDVSDDLLDTFIGASRTPLVNCAVDWLATHDSSEQWKYMSLILLGSAQGLGEWAASDRVAYGLIGYPVPKTVDTYFRVGIFFSLPSNGGGLPLFDRCSEGPITLL